MRVAFLIPVLLFVFIISGFPDAGGIVGFEEKPGGYIPLDLPFVSETGKAVKLGDVVKGPTVLTLVYYRCPNACDNLLIGLAAALRPFALKPETVPNLVTISFDDRETPADSLKQKNIAYEAIEAPYPVEKWHFLTGGSDSIKKITDAAGFRYARAGNEFNHPVGCIILSPDGKIVRYIIGAEILPMDLKVSLMEASSGTVSPTIARVIRFCFSYDPASHAYVFNILRVSATVIFGIIGVFVIYLVLSGRKRRAGQ
ncbi:MAG: SCO family protein [Brevinematales bacterium]|jgi:protein SCO1/2